MSDFYSLKQIVDAVEFADNVQRTQQQLQDLRAQEHIWEEAKSKLDRFSNGAVDAVGYFDGENYVVTKPESIIIVENRGES